MNIYDLVIVFENYLIIKILELFISEIRLNHLATFIMSIILTIESLVLDYYQIDEVLKLIVPILTLVIYCSIYCRNFLANLLKVFVTFLNLTFIHMLVIVCSTMITGDVFQSFNNDYLIMFVLTCVSIMTLGIEYIFLRNRYSSTYQLSRYSIIVLGISSIITFVMINVILKNYVLSMISITLCMSVTFSFIFFLFLVTVLCVLNAKYYESNLEQSLKLEAYDFEDKYINVITEKTIEYNKLRHDMKTHFDILERMINASHIQEAKDYMEQISFDQGEHFIHLNHLTLNFLLNNKIKLAKSHNIDICCMILGKPSLFITDVDYSILVGNLLDNAIEASIEVKSHTIHVSMSFDEEIFVIEVKNKVIKKIKSRQFLTTKKDKNKHGIGLNNIKDIVEKYSGQDITEIKDNIFLHMCMLYKPDET